MFTASNASKPIIAFCGARDRDHRGYSRTMGQGRRDRTPLFGVTRRPSTYSFSTVRRAPHRRLPRLRNSAKARSAEDFTPCLSPQVLYAFRARTQSENACAPMCTLSGSPFPRMLRGAQGLPGDDNEFLRSRVVVKDTTIAALLERDRETNVLVGRLQQMLAPLLGTSTEPPPDRSAHAHVGHDLSRG